MDMIDPIGFPTKTPHYEYNKFDGKNLLTEINNAIFE